MSKFFDTVWPTYIESWPDELMRFSFATKLIMLTEEERRELINLCQVVGYGDGLPIDEQAIAGLENKITEAINIFPKGAFVRLGSRSPKDSWEGHNAKFCCTSGKHALQWFAESERIHDDLQLAKINDYLPFVAVREYKEINPDGEFRILVKDRRIVGVSQYDYHEYFPSIDTDSLRWVIEMFWHQIANALPMDSVIVDVWAYYRAFLDTYYAHRWEVKLIEINPFFEYTDPCLFDWRSIDEWSRSDPYEIRVRSEPKKAIDYSGLLTIREDGI